MLHMLMSLTHISLLSFQRRDVITGTVEPTDEECEWQSDREEEEELAVRRGGGTSLTNTFIDLNWHS